MYHGKYPVFTGWNNAPRSSTAILIEDQVSSFRQTLSPRGVTWQCYECKRLPYQLSNKQDNYALQQLSQVSSDSSVLTSCWASVKLSGNIVTLWFQLSGNQSALRRSEWMKEKRRKRNIRGRVRNITHILHTQQRTSQYSFVTDR